MWIGLILSLVFCTFIVVAVYVEETTNLYLDYNISENYFRREIKKEPYDGYGSYYVTKMDDATKAEYIAYNKKLRIKSTIKQTLVHCIPVVVAAVIIFGFSAFGSFIENESLAEDIASHEAYVMTIEASLDNEDLTGLERLELVKQASEQNAWLSKKKYSCHRWYSFYLRDDLVNKIDSLEMIDLS